MNVNDKITAAAEDVRWMVETGYESTTCSHDLMDYINDAANFCSESYAEYNAIFVALTALFCN